MNKKKKLPELKILNAGKNVRKNVCQSGAAPYLRVNGEYRVMLVTPGAGGGWILPKGHIAKGHDRPSSAAKEAMEEAGVVGSCGEKILGITRIARPGKPACIVNIYPLKIEKVLEDWPEKVVRKRRLFRLPEAIRLMPDAVSREILENLMKQLETGEAL